MSSSSSSSSSAFISTSSATATSSSSQSQPQPPLPEIHTKSDLKFALLAAIRAERERKARRRAAGLPETESSSSESDDEDDDAANVRGGADAETRAYARRVRENRRRNVAAAASAAASSASASSQASAASSSSSSSATNYSTAEYWNQRYARTQGLFDWYVEYVQLEPLLSEYGKKVYDCVCGGSAAMATGETVAMIGNNSSSSSHNSVAVSSTSPATSSSTPSPFPRSSLHLLDVGCGNSGLGADLYSAGWTRLTHIDISSTIIDRMKEKYASIAGTNGEWITMDATMMTFETNSMDLLLEKGTIDALDCSTGADVICHNILSECSRVLKPGGTLLLITHGAPRRRLPMLSKPEFGWKVEIKTVQYSNSALFIRGLRKKMQGRPISSASPEVMAECALEVRALKALIPLQMERARRCIARVQSELDSSPSTSFSSSTAAASQPLTSSPHVPQPQSQSQSLFANIRHHPEDEEKEEAKDDGRQQEDEQVDLSSMNNVNQHDSISQEEDEEDRIFSPASTSICFVYACMKKMV